MSGHRKSNSTTSTQPTIPQEVTKKLLQQYDLKKGGSAKRINQESTNAISEVLRVFLVEARARASIEVRRGNQIEKEDIFLSLLYFD